MNTDQFWQIIDSSRRKLKPDQADGNMERQRQELESLLSKLPLSEIIAFDNQLTEKMNAAYRWDLWGAAHILAGDCSDDGFVDFRGWLISMGRRIFESAVADAESLVAIADDPGIEDVFFEGFINVPEQVYKHLTGNEIPGHAAPSPGEPAGAPWNSAEDELQQRLPKLWSKYRTTEARER